MSTQAMKMRLYNVWQPRVGDDYLLLSTSSRWEAEQARSSAEGDYMTEQDTWIEIPEEPGEADPEPSDPSTKES